MPTKTEIFITLLAMEHAALDRWGRGDPSGFLEISDEDVVYFDPFRERRVDGLPALSALYESFRGQVQLESYEILNPKVQTWNGGAVLTFNYTSLSKSGKTTHWNCTEVYRLTEAGWRIIQTHWSFTQAMSSVTMIETHPFEIFVPPNAKFLILGSFAAKEASKDHPKFDASYDWYYGTRRNQFWTILEAVYSMELRDKQSKQDLFTRLGIGIGDIIYQVERDKDSSLDYYLINPVYNKDAIAHAVDNNPIHIIFFTSRFVEKRFCREFKEIIIAHPTIELIALPSPSTRYARMSLEQKIIRYKDLLPKFS